AGPAVVDFISGIHLYAGTLTALFERERTGRGRVVSLLFDQRDARAPSCLVPGGPGAIIRPIRNWHFAATRGRAHLIPSGPRAPPPPRAARPPLQPPSSPC